MLSWQPCPGASGAGSRATRREKLFKGHLKLFFTSSERGCGPRRHCRFILSGSVGRSGEHRPTQLPPAQHGTASPETCHRSRRHRRRAGETAPEAPQTNNPSLGTFISRFLTVKVNKPHIKDQLHCEATAARTARVCRGNRLLPATTIIC